VAEDEERCFVWLVLESSPVRGRLVVGRREASFLVLLRSCLSSSSGISREYDQYFSLVNLSVWSSPKLPPPYLPRVKSASSVPGTLCIVFSNLRSYVPWSIPSPIRAPGRARRLQLGGTCPSTTIPTLSPSTRSVSLLLAHNDSLVLFSSFVTVCSTSERWRRGHQALTNGRVPHLRTVTAITRNQTTRTTRAETRVTGAVTQTSHPTEVSTTSEPSLAAPREMPMTVRVQLDQHYLFGLTVRPQLPFRRHLMI